VTNGIEEFVAAFSGSNRFVLDYLLDEVLATQPDGVRAFLLDTSVLGRFTGALCDAVTGRDDGDATLELLERRNLFLIPLDDNRQWFRYHHLFADTLRARLVAEDPDRVPHLQRAASEWHAEHGDLVEAIEYAGATGDVAYTADLVELAHTAVAVVCAGAKSILDIGKTLEVLETKGVPVIGYATDAFPAFWARESGHKVDHRFDTVEEIARIVALQADLGLGGVLVANPIPEADALPADAIEARISEAIADAAARGVSRKDLTPFLLQRIFELTQGQSLKANIALVENNARVAARIAVALSAMTAAQPAVRRA
jgi:hypothetical protein